MSEPDTFDLDRAFESLTNDVAGASRPPGARNAITRSRRRRTTLASVAGVAALAVAATALQLSTSHRSAEPTGGVDDPLPAVRTFDAAAFTSATDGWAGPWAEVSPDAELDQIATVLGDPACLDAINQTGPEPQLSTGNLFLVNPAKTAIAFGVLVDFPAKAAPAAQMWDALTTGLDNCADATAGSDVTWVGGQARSWSVTPSTGKAGPQHVWFAREANALAILYVAGAPVAVPDGVDTQVGSALVAGLQDSAAFTPVSGSGSGSSSGSASGSASPEVTLGDVSEADFADALGTWQSGWRRDTGPKVDITPPPCLGLSGNGSAGGTGTNVGGNGSVELDSFVSPSDAAASLQRVPGQLDGCSSAQWTVRQVQRTGASPVLVATSPYQGGLVAWVVQAGSSIGYITVAGGVSTLPPDSVSTAVAAVLQKALAPTGP